VNSSALRVWWGAGTAASVAVVAKHRKDQTGDDPTGPDTVRSNDPLKNVPSAASEDVLLRMQRDLTRAMAKRNWYPLSSDIYEEIIPSIGEAYPYPVKALFLYMGAPTYALPAGHTNIEVLCDTKKVPLFIANDILIGTTSMYADYIFPDLSFLERWEFQGSHPNVTNIHAGTGKHNPGYACHIPIRGFTGKEPTELRKGHDLALITHRVISQTKSRTIANPWLSALLPENGILIHPSDASRLGIANGQKVKVVSATNTSGEWDLGGGRKKPMIGKAVVTQTIRPGVVSFALGFGHWATGAEDVTIDGHLVKGEPRRAAGIHANASMWVDPDMKNTCFVDTVGGSVSFYDTHVTLVPLI
jgi:anaerobic selenocysteine-containing dehydrogenase